MNQKGEEIFSVLAKPRASEHHMDLSGSLAYFIPVDTAGPQEYYRLAHGSTELELPSVSVCACHKIF